MAKGYPTLPREVFGLRPSQHRKRTMQKVLLHFGIRRVSRLTKKDLLYELSQLQETLISEQAETVTDWLGETTEQTIKDAMLHGVDYAQTERYLGRLRITQQSKNGYGLDHDLEEKELEELIAPHPRTMECNVCLENLELVQFPKNKITTSCEHEPTTCRNCICTSVNAQIPAVAWDQVKCPECSETLPYDKVKEWASEDDFVL
jgi:hypothetical protein